jgi:hypothetical protein
MINLKIASVFLEDIAKEVEKHRLLYWLYSSQLTVVVSNFTASLNGKESGIM